MLIGNNIPLLQSVKSSLKSSFSMKDLGEANYILRIRIYRNRLKRLIGLSQSTYIDKKRFNMQDSKRGSFLVLYVDDIMLIRNNIPLLQSVKSSLKSSFSMKNLGEANYILGIRIYRNRSKRLIGLSQSTYIDKKRFNMQDSKRESLPMSSGISLCKN
jgi:Reverse transcriptase (RNA-dependent DNA polymerase)